MNRICRRVVAAAGALALAGGTALAVAGPASAAPGSDNFSYAASTDGFLSTGEVALAENEPFRHVVTAGHLSELSNLVTAGSVVDTANDNGASSTVASVNVRSILASLGLTARIVHSSCTSPTGPGIATGTTSILAGQVGVGGFGQSLPSNPSVDQPVSLPGGITVLLNDQSTDGDQLTVNALLIELPGGTDITVGTSSCEGTIIP
jgi:hypothetical protein